MVGYTGFRKNLRTILERSRTRVVINSMFIYHFVDPDLRTETFFEKDEAAENGGVHFQIGDIGTSSHLKKIQCRACLLSYCFLVTKK